MEEHLLLFTEVSIAIIGFAGVAIALTQGKRSWDFFDKVNVWFIFTHSVIAFICSQTYLVLVKTMPPEFALNSGLRVFAVLWIATVLGATVPIFRLRNRNFRTSVLSTFVGKLIVFGAYTGGLLIAILLVLANLKLLHTDATIYTGSIATILLLAIAHFAYFIGVNIQTEFGRSTNDT